MAAATLTLILPLISNPMWQPWPVSYPANPGPTPQALEAAAAKASSAQDEAEKATPDPSPNCLICNAHL